MDCDLKDIPLSIRHPTGGCVAVGKMSWILGNYAGDDYFLCQTCYDLFKKRHVRSMNVGAVKFELLQPISSMTDTAELRCTCGIKLTGGNHSDWCDVLKLKDRTTPEFDELFYTTLAPNAPRDVYTMVRLDLCPLEDLITQLRQVDLLVELNTTVPMQIRYHKDRWSRSLGPKRLQIRHWETLRDAWTFSCGDLEAMLYPAGNFWSVKQRSQFIAIKRSR